LLALIRTLFDIVLLRTGPEVLPNSWLVLNLTIGLWIAALLATAGALTEFRGGDVLVAIASAAIGAACYLVVLAAAGRRSRAMQTLSAIIGCGALVSFAVVAELVLLTPLVGAYFANLGAIILLFWSVPVKGHIVARAIDQHWFAGIAIAMAVFIIQYAFSTSFGTEAQSG